MRKPAIKLLVACIQVLTGEGGKGHGFLCVLASLRDAMPLVLALLSLPGVFGRRAPFPANLFFSGGSRDARSFAFTVLDLVSALSAQLKTLTIRRLRRLRR